MPINASARDYLDYQLQYVPDYEDPLKKYRARQEKLEEELDKIGVQDPTERNRIRREYLGNEPISEGGFFSEQLPRSAARGGLGLVENIGAVGEYLGDVTDLDVVKEPFGALARTFRREKEELDPAYDSADPGISDYVNMAVESGLASAPAMVAPMGGARLGFLGARALLGAGGKEASKRALMGGAIGGGFVGGSASNAGLEGGTTYSQVKEQMLQQGFSDREAEQEARRQADFVATQNLGANPELLGYNVAQSFAGPAGKLLGGATGRANALRRMGAGSTLEGLQEGAQYEVQQQAAGNMDANRFMDKEGRTSMIVGAISDLPFSVADVALPDPNYQKVDSRVDPEASAIKRSQEAAYAQVEESDRLEAQRQEALRQQEERTRKENEEIQKTIKQQDEARKRQLQLERERLKLMSERARYRKETDPINFTMRDPAIEMGDGTTPQAEELRQIPDDKLPGEREAEALRIPKSGLWQDGEEIADPTFGFGRQKQPGEDVDFTMKEGGFDSRLPTAPEQPAPEPEPQQEFTMRDSAIEIPAGPMDQPTAPAPRQIEEQQEYNYPVPAAPEPAPAPMEQEQEAAAPETPVLPAINDEGKTNNGRVTDDSAGAIPETVFAPPELPTLVNRRDQPDLEPDAPLDENARPSGGSKEGEITNPLKVREKFEEIGYQDQKPVLGEGIDGLIQSKYSQALPNVFVFEGLTSWSAAHFNGGVGIAGRYESDSDKSRIGYLLAHEFGHASHSLLGDKINANSAVKNELKAIEEFLYPGLRQRVQEADTEGQNIDKQFFNYLLSAEELIAEINPYRLTNPEQVQKIAPTLSKLLASVEQTPDLVIPRTVFPRGTFFSKTQAIGKLDENLKLKADRQVAGDQLYDQDNSAFEAGRLLKGNLNKDYGFLGSNVPFDVLQSAENQIELTTPKGKIELATVYSDYGYSKDRQKIERAAQLMDEAFKADSTKAEKPFNKDLKQKIDARLSELNQTEPVVEDAALNEEAAIDDATVTPTQDSELQPDVQQEGDRISYSSSSRPTMDAATAPSTKLTVRQVKAAMEGVKSVLKKLDPNGDKVTVVANKDEAVAKLREMNRNRLADQLANDKGTEGFTITSTGEIFLLADQIEGGNLRGAVDRMVEVTFHEALGHAGLRGLMGDNFGKFVQNFGIKNNKKINAWLKTSEGNPYSNNDRNTQIEEYIARNFAEKGAQDVQFLENLVQNVMSFFGLRKYSETALKQAMLKVQDAYLDRGGDILNGVQQTEQENTEQEGEEQTEDPAPQQERPRPTRTVQYKPPRSLEKSTKYMDFADQAYALFGRYNSPEEVQKAIAEFVVRKKDKESLLTYENLDQIGEILRKNREFKERAKGGMQAEIRTSRRPNVIGGDVPLSQWETPLESKTNNFLYKMQDKMIDTKEVIKAIKKSGKDITDRWNAYLQEELYHGRTAKETADFLKRELEPLMEALRKENTTIPDFEKYLWNRHAQERNEQIARVNPNMPDGGSGLSTAEAQAYLNNLSPTQRKTFEDLAQKIDAITAQTRQVLKDASLESQDTVDRWEGVYDYYVPLEREEFDFSPVQQGLGIGQGMDVRGSASKRATGSSLAVKDILANVALQRERAITRKHKNRVAQAIYGLAAQNPNPDFWLVIDPEKVKDPDALAQQLADMGIDPNDVENIAKEPVTTTIDKRSGLVTRKVNASLRNSDNFLSTRINGENKFIIFNAKNPISQRMVSSLKNLDADQLGTSMSIVADITRYMASINTQYNPIFGVVNLVRDVQGAAFNLSSTPLAGKQREVARNLPSALRGIYSNLRNDTNRNKGKTPLGENEFSTLYEEFQQEGGQTGYRDQFVRRDERAIELQKMLDPSSWADSSLGKVFTIDGKLKVPLETARQKAKPMFDWLTDYNETMENAIRLSAYKVAKDQGMSNEQAASLAKNLTVNFNRKGQIATQAGALYSFFNAAVQGTARLHETMKGPAGKKIFVGGALLGIGQAVALAAAGFDEEEPPYFVRERNLIIPTFVGSGYITVPMPLGLHVLPNAFRIIAEGGIKVLSGGNFEPGKRVAKITGSFLDAFNPIGNAGWSVQTIAPTAFDPIVALSENRDWTGKPIAREDMVSTRPSPGYTRAKDTASWLSEKLAYGFNIMSGGTDYKKGLFSPTPDQLDYLIGQATGGVGREALKIMQTGQTIYTGEELPPYKIPLAGRFYGNTESSAAESNRFYNNITRLNEHEAEIKGRRENRENPGQYIRDNPESRLVDFAGKVENEVRKLRKRKRDLMDRGASRSSIETIEKLITRRMKSLNDRVRRYQ